MHDPRRAYADKRSVWHVAERVLQDDTGVSADRDENRRQKDGKGSFHRLSKGLVAGELYSKGWRHGADGPLQRQPFSRGEDSILTPSGAAAAASFCRWPHAHPTASSSFHGECLRSPRPRSTRRSWCTQSVPETESLVIWARRKYKLERRVKRIVAVISVPFFVAATVRSRAELSRVNRIDTGAHVQRPPPATSRSQPR